MKKHLLAAFVALALVAGVLGFSVPATPAATNQTQQTFSVSAAGQDSPIIPLNGYSSCSVQIDNAGTGMTLTAQSTSDANPTVSSQWATVTTIGTSGSITTFGIFTGNVAGVGLTGFKFHVAALTTGPVTGSISCSTATAGGGAVVISSLPPISISPLPLPVTVTNTPGVTVQNTPGVTVQNTPGVVCVSGCGGAKANTYPPCLLTTAAANVVCKNSSATLVGFVNNSQSAQTGKILCYDNATTNSGTVIASVAALGATQVITFPGLGIGPTTNGITCVMDANATGTSVQVLYF